MGKKKILMVDDEPEFVNMLKMRLENAGYRVVCAENGTNGLASARSEKPDLIILDILMPQKDGYAFVKEARQENALKGIPIIVLTAKPAMEDKFKEGEISGYMMKPFEAQELLERIEKILAK